MEVIYGLKIKFDLRTTERNFHMKSIKLHSIVYFQALFSLQFKLFDCFEKTTTLIRRPLSLFTSNYQFYQCNQW